MTEGEARKKYSGFLPSIVKAKLAATSEPTEDAIAAARALLAKVDGKRGPGRPRAEAAE